jgi:hypothetical protein
LGVTSLGKEWRYYKKELDNIRRKAKRDNERKAEQAQRQSFYERSGPPRNETRRDYSRDGGNGGNGGNGGGEVGRDNRGYERRDNHREGHGGNRGGPSYGGYRR